MSNRRSRTPAHSYRDAPCNPRQKCSLILGLLPPAIAKELQESLLHSVFSVVRVQQNRICHPEDEARLPLDKRCKLRVCIGRQTRALLRLQQDEEGYQALNPRCTSPKTARRVSVFRFLSDCLVRKKRSRPGCG